jgi:transglutaminase-like putative cysteine protease
MRLVVLLALAVAVSAAKEAPSWVEEAAHQTIQRDYPPKVNRVTLLAEEHLTVDSDGRRTMTERGVIKILQPGGKAPEAIRTYNPKSGRIRDFRAWLLLPSGKETEYDKKRVLDIALDQHFTYDEGRAKLIECDADAPAGAVFAYEVTEEEDTIFTTYHYSFQENSPVVVSRFVLSMPAGWEARGTVFNHDDIQPQVAGSTYTWESRDLPPIEEEERSPGWHAVAPRLAVTYFPASVAKAELRPLKDWPAVSGWLSGFVDPPAAVTPAVRAKAQELTGSSRTELDKIKAIAAFAQQTNYVSVQMNLTRGGGYTPHPADQVLSRNYGDCKDKANLMRALLQAVGIEAYPVVIYSGDREFVRREWPSPMQFNHAIIAVKVSAETSLPTVIGELPQLGRLLIFDPTDPVTPVGDLPESEQGSFALVIAGTQGNLVRVPLLPAFTNRIELAVDAQMDAAGAVAAAPAHAILRAVRFADALCLTARDTG